MELFDCKNREIRFTDERRNHLTENHPEMNNQIDRVIETLHHPDCIIASRTDNRSKRKLSI